MHPHSSLMSRALGSERTRYSLGVSGYFAALFLIYGVHLPFLPLWLDSRGLDAAEIALVTAAPYLFRLIVTPAVALHSDRSGTHRSDIIVLSVLSAALALGLSQMQGFWPILVVAVLLALSMTTVMPLLEVLAVGGVRAHGLTYGRMRLWGSAAFIVASLLGAAALDAYGAGSIIWLIVVGAGITAAASLALPRSAGQGAAASPAGERIRLADAGLLITSPVFLLFLLASGGIQSAHAMFYTFGSLHWQKQGLDGVTIGTLWTLGVLAEIALFAWSGSALRRLGATGLLALGGAAAMARWTAMAFDPPLAALVPLQLLHALSFAATHLGAIMFIGAAIPERLAGTAQALHATVGAGVALGGATMLAGALYPSFDGLAYLGMTGLSTIGLLAAVSLKARWAGGAILLERG